MLTPRQLLHLASRNQWLPISRLFNQIKKTPRTFFQEQPLLTFLSATNTHPRLVAMTVNTLGALVKSEFKIDRRKFQRPIQQALEKYSPIMDHLSIPSTLLGLVHLNFNWGELSQSLRRKLITALKNNTPQMTPQGLYNSLWALAHLNLHKPNIEESKLIQLLFATLPEVTDKTPISGAQQVSSAFYYFKHRFPKLKFDNTHYIELLKKLPTHPSHIQAELVKRINLQLAETPYSLDLEHLLLCFKVDAYARKIVLEIDGPSHNERQQRRVDEFQNNLLADYGYTTLRLSLRNYDLLSEEEQDDLMNQLANIIKSEEIPEFTHIPPVIRTIRAKNQKPDVAKYLINLGLMPKPVAPIESVQVNVYSL